VATSNVTEGLHDTDLNDHRFGWIPTERHASFKQHIGSRLTDVPALICRIAELPEFFL